MNLHQSSRQMALRLDELLADGESIVCYSRARYSALFYTDRPVRVIKSPKELSELMSTDGRAYCVISSSRYHKIGFQAPIVYEIGDDLLISNRRAEEE